MSSDKDAQLLKRKPGRPKGANNKNFLTLQFWYNQMRVDMEQLKPYQRAIVCQKMMQCLMSHDRHLQKDKQADELRADESLSEAELIDSLSNQSDDQPNQSL